MPHRRPSAAHDFERPPEQDWTETVLTLANLSLFIIADISKPASIPQELQALVPNCMVPFVPLLKKGEDAFSMFPNLQVKHDWVLPVVAYEREDDLISSFDEAVLNRATIKRREINERKAQPIAMVDLADLRP